MLTDILESTGLYRNKKFDTGKFILCGVPFIAFVIWRVFTLGVAGSDRIMNSLEQEMINDYKEVLYKQYGFYDNDIGDNELAKDFPAEELVGLEVEFDNVSMSAPLLSWSATENVGIRFDYRLTKDGIVKKSGQSKYLLADRKSLISFWDCGAFTYYLQYL